MREPMLMAPGTGAATVALSCPWLSAASGWARATATLGVAYLRASKNEPLVDAKSLARSFVGEREDEAGISAALTVGPPSSRTSLCSSLPQLACGAANVTKAGVRSAADHLSCV